MTPESLDMAVRALQYALAVLLLTLAIPTAMGLLAIIRKGFRR